VDYFEFMEFPRKMGLDPALLEKRFYELSREYHPDLVQGKSDKEKLLAQGKSALLNKAYQTLKDPVERAEHLLSLESPTSQKERTQIDPSLAAEIFEIQEKVEEEKRAKDPALKTELLEARRSVEGKIQARNAALEGYFKEWDLLRKDSPEKQTLAKTIRKTLDEITYLKNLIQSIDTGGRVRH